MSRSHRSFRLLSVLALLVLVAGLAAPVHARPAAAPRGNVPADAWEPFSALWGSLRQLWEGRGSAGHGLHSLAGAEGASLDPHGGSTTGGSGTGTAPTQGDSSH